MNQKKGIEHRLDHAAVDPGRAPAVKARLRRPGWGRRYSEIVKRQVHVNLKRRPRE